MINKFHRQFITLLVILLLGTIIVSACGGREISESTALPAPSSTPEPTYEDVVITLERTGCNDACPDYRLAITGNGTVIYVGYARVGSSYHAEIEDAHTTTISLEQVEELISEFERIDFFSLNSYAQLRPQNPDTITTSITINGKTNTVQHHFSSRNSGISGVPKELFELENKIDEIVNVNQWVEKP